MMIFNQFGDATAFQGVWSRGALIDFSMCVPAYFRCQQIIPPNLLSFRVAGMIALSGLSPSLAVSQLPVMLCT